MNVPKLRFKADDGSEFPEWEEKRLGDICEPLMYGMGAAAIPYDGQNKYIRITDIDDESHKYKSNDIVSPAGMLEEKYLVCKGDILLARTGASTGKSYLYDEKDGKMYFAGFLIKAHVNEECDAKFIYAQTLTTKYMNWVKLTSMRSGQPGINANEYSSYAVSIACIPEQQKIADFLSTIDEIIQSTESELTAWQERKKGVMQKIFNREVRFKADDGSEFPEWEEKTLFDVLDNVVDFRGRTPKKLGMDWSSEKTDYLALSALNVKMGYIDDSVDPHYGDSILYHRWMNGKELYKGEVLFTTEAPMGNIAQVPDDKPYILSQRVIALIPVKAVICEDFLCCVLQSGIVQLNLKTLATGGTAQGISQKSLEKLRLTFPSIPEQRKIADCLSSLDDVINQIKAELSAWKEFKKGLLQQMFV